METFSFEEVKNVSVGSGELKFCSVRDADCSNVVGIVIVQDEYVSVPARRWNEERAGLICGNVTGRCKAGSIDMVGLGWI